MGGYTKTVTQSFEFDGDTIVVEFGRLKRRDMVELLPVFQRLSEAGESAPIEDKMKLFELADKLLPEYVVKLEGAPIPLGGILEEAYFMPLVSDILNALFMASTVSQVTEKKSGGPSAAPSVVNVIQKRSSVDVVSGAG